MDPVRAKVRQSKMVVISAVAVLLSMVLLALPLTWAAVCGVPFLLLIGNMLKRHKSHAPGIIVANDGIAVNGKEYHWRQVKALRSVRKTIVPGFGSVDPRAVEAVEQAASMLNDESIQHFDTDTPAQIVWISEIEFANGELVRFRDDMYTNTWQIRDVILKKIEDSACNIRYTDPFETAGQVNGYFTWYRGLQFASAKGWVMWIALFLGCLVSLIMGGLAPGMWAFIILFAGCFGLALFVACSQSMQYIGLSDKYLLIGYYNLPGRSEVYMLSDVEELALEIDGGLSLHVKGWKSSTYTMPTISRKQWDTLRDELERRNVPVIDRRIYMYS